MRHHIYWVAVVLGLPLLGLTLFYHDSPHLLEIGTVELGVIAFVVNAFVILYFRRNWRANPYGRALMYAEASFAIIANLSIVTAFLGPDWAWRGAVRVILFTALLITQSRLLQLLFTSSGKHDKKDYDDSHDSSGREI